MLVISPNLKGLKENPVIQSVYHYLEERDSGDRLLVLKSDQRFRDLEHIGKTENLVCLRVSYGKVASPRRNSTVNYLPSIAT